MHLSRVASDILRYMKLGIKVNADKESFARLSEANPSLAEVWFNVNAANGYTELFDELKRRKCDVGLHFWGQLAHHIAPNIAYPDQAVIDESLAQMRQTIDIAATNHFQYVNIHPGASAISKVDYAKETYSVVGDPVDTETSTQLFLAHAQDLHAYAASRNVVFTVETVPSRITRGWYNETARLNPHNMYELPASAITKAASSGVWIANDFCHTAANVITDDPDVVWTYLKGFTNHIAAATRLIHLGFVVPPYNGTDNHDELDNPILDTDAAVPNTKQMLELLKLFRNRDDVWILVEPKKNHVKNYFLAQKLLEQASSI
jgi:sugar phosphate isomerase/epimerase